MLLENPTVSDLSVHAKNQLSSPQDVALLLVGEKSGLILDELVHTFKQEGIPFFGGLFPAVIYGTVRSETGVVLQVVSAKHPPQISPIQSTSFITPETTLPGQQDTALVFVDGLTKGIGRFLEEFNNQLGSEYSFLGGGAGSLSLVQQPCVFNNEGVFQDAAVYCLLNNSIRLGVRHGWQRIEGPFVVTEAEGNVIKQLNWQPAINVYREVVEHDAGSTLTIDNFFSIAKGYPFGMIRENEEDIVRDPISTNEEGELICVGEVPTNTVLYILKGESDQLIEAAIQARDDAMNTGGQSVRQTFIVDCISRTLFLEDRFNEELQAVQVSDSAKPTAGVLSLGEISSYGTGALEFFNKTIVVGAFLKTNTNS